VNNTTAQVKMIFCGKAQVIVLRGTRELGRDSLLQYVLLAQAIS